MPILGPMIGVTILVFAGLLSIETLWLAFVPAGIRAHSRRRRETITRCCLPSASTINPVLVILALVFWYWMWGILGAIWPSDAGDCQNRLRPRSLSHHSAISSRDDAPRTLGHQR
jgi:hypothetical protein